MSKVGVHTRKQSRTHAHPCTPHCPCSKPHACPSTLETHTQAELKDKLASSYDVKDPQGIFLFGFRTQV